MHNEVEVLWARDVITSWQRPSETEVIDLET
jgi:hypothetical protein